MSRNSTMMAPGTPSFSISQSKVRPNLDSPVVIVSSRTGAPAVVVPATFDGEEGIGVLGAEAEEAKGAETSTN